MGKYTITWLLLVAVTGLWGYNFGSLTPRAVEDPLDGLHETICDEIVGKPNHYTGQNDLVCEITLTTEDQPLKIYKGE